MLHRLIAVSTVAAFLTATLFWYSDIRSSWAARMSDSAIEASVPFEVELSTGIDAEYEFGSVVVHIKITNKTPYPIFLLSWLSPLDPKAVAMGTFSFISTKTNEPAPCLDIKLNRKPPAFFAPSDHAIIELPANGEIKRAVVAKQPEVALTKGERYRVKTEGHWMTFWVQEDAATDMSQLKMEDGKSGEYASNEIEIDVPKDADGEL
ncbi:hypothetical protein HYFRA_00012372 [Hymenoscyphus fraxineus]|uniref:Uncharacterized protein n=1 Tax=Hymenoscyphus fraxineus TaxID=746836 RepID=A0A9N9PWS8_9HELO|nr:hypothetical protein HYFRA_00012372 [Hymenoscyphus fraxineus]